VVAQHFGRHPDAEIYTSQPGLGVVLAARVLGEFGDDPRRFDDAKARKNYAGTSPITKASGRKKVVHARHARNKRLADALQQWATCSLRGSPGANAYYHQLRDRKIGHNAAQAA
jgi:transposase